MSTDPTPLYSDDAERAMIGAAIIEPSIIQQVEITDADFYSSRNRLTWAQCTGSLPKV